MILIVDDESDSRKLLTAVLASEGYRVRAADTGELALAAIDVKRPELILLDIRMPGMDGLEVCRRLKRSAETRDIPVIFLSANSEVSERIQGIQAGAVDYITKPFHKEELLARVRTHLELVRLRNRLEQLVLQRTAELSESEQRFRNMADAAPVIIWASDTEKRCTFCNKGWLEFTGRALAEELGDGWTERLHPDDRDGFYSAYCSAFDARRAFQIEFRVRRADGSYRWLLNHGAPRVTSSGMFAGYVGSCVDVTELKQSHEHALLAHKLESLGLMAAGVAHDFGNFLGGILAEADIAAAGLPPESSVRENLDRIGEQVSHANEMVRVLIDSAGAGIDPNAAQPVDLSSVVEQTLRLLRPSVLKNAVVHADLAPDLPPAWGCPPQVRQIALNLITNAAEALTGKQGTIVVNTEKVVIEAGEQSGSAYGLRQGEYVCLRVIDTGCGMNSETQARIFDQFFTTKSQGRGLGLATVHGIVRSHGGAIRVHSAPESGSTFEVLLPSVAQPAETVAA